MTLALRPCAATRRRAGISRRSASILSQIAAAISGAAEILDRADAGRRGDVDLGEEAVDHVDADEEKPALAQRRPEPGADLALALGEVGRLGHAAAHHVGAQIVRRRHAVDRAGELAVDQDDALVAVLHRRQEFLHHPGLAEGARKEIVKRAEIEVRGRDLEHRLRRRCRRAASSRFRRARRETPRSPRGRG